MNVSFLFLPQFWGSVLETSKQTNVRCPSCKPYAVHPEMCWDPKCPQSLMISGVKINKVAAVWRIQGWTYTSMLWSEHHPSIGIVLQLLQLVSCSRCHWSTPPKQEAGPNPHKSSKPSIFLGIFESSTANDLSREGHNLLAKCFIRSLHKAEKLWVAATLFGKTQHLCDSAGKSNLIWSKRRCCIQVWGPLAGKIHPGSRRKTTAAKPQECKLRQGIMDWIGCYGYIQSS